MVCCGMEEGELCSGGSKLKARKAIFMLDNDIRDDFNHMIL